jgi:hypothetical protein
MSLHDSHAVVGVDQVGVVGSGQGMTDFESRKKHRRSYE